MTSNPLFGSVELKNMNETSHDHESNIDDAVSALERKKKILNQLDMPWTVETSKFEPTFFKCNGKIVKYDSKGLAIWRALVSASHTIISDWDTWNHLNALTVICFLTMGICIGTDSYRSVIDNNSVTARIQVLISFVFASYITIVINRWDRIRNTTLGTAWGAIENLNMIVFAMLREPTPENIKLCNLFIRHSRLVMRLIFLAVQGDGNLTPLLKEGILLEKEQTWLEATTIGTRPLMVVSWMGQFFDKLRTIQTAGHSDIMQSQIVTQLTGLRGGIGATLGTIGTQLPYPYVHIVYWTIQILLTSLAIETGVVLATDWYFQKNGAGEYSPADDTVSWPHNERIWYTNRFLQITASNVVFALFSEGMLKICEKLSNPLSIEDTSFSETAFDAFLHNNCRALWAGNAYYDDLNYEEFDALKKASSTTSASSSSSTVNSKKKET